MVIGFSGVGAAQSGNNSTVEGSPNIDAFISDNTIRPGEQKTFTVQLRNQGDLAENGPSTFEREVQEARNVVVSFESAPAVDIQTGQVAVRDLSKGQTVETQVSVSAAQDIDDEEDIHVDTSYTYTDVIVYNTTNNERVTDSEREITVTDDVEIRAIDTARFSATSVDDNDIPIGETGITSIEVENIGSEDVSDASLTLQSTSSDVTFGQSETTTVQIGELDDYDETTFDIPVRFAESASQTAYTIESTMTYRNENGQQRSADVQDFSLTPNQDMNIGFVNSSTNATVGGSGETNISLQNDGPYDIRDATVRISSNSGLVSFGGQSGMSVIDIGEWETDEIVNVTVSTDVSDDSSIEPYSVSTTVSYTNNDDIDNSETVNGVNVIPQSEQNVTTQIQSSDIAEGEEGTIAIRVSNNGPKTIDQTKVSATGSDSISFLQTSRNIGSIEDGESKIAEIPAESPSGLDSNTQNVDITVEYEYDGSDGRETVQNFSTIAVEENKNLFEISATNNTVSQGAQKTIQVTISNSMNQQISDIDAEFTTSDPLSLSQDTVFIDSLDSETNQTINLSVQSTANALPNTYSITVDFEYQDADGTTKLSDVYSIPVTVSEPDTESTGPPITILIVLSLFASGIFTIIYRFRDEIRTKLR